MSSPPFIYQPPGDPSEYLVNSVRIECRNEAQRIIHNGGGKIARVRIEVEFDNGESVLFERTP
jgi:hypothetical protein